MKLTKSKLKQIIKEELRKVLQEKIDPQGPFTFDDMDPYQHDYLDYEDCARRMPPHGLGDPRRGTGCYGGYFLPKHARPFSGNTQEEYNEQCTAYCRDKHYPGDWVGTTRIGHGEPPPEAPADADPWRG